MRLHHVQLACPAGGEPVARRFWAEGLGMAEVDKPADLAARGGAWFRWYDASDAVAAEVHVGFEVDRSERTSVPGHERFHCADGHGNRVELLAPIPPADR